MRDYRLFLVVMMLFLTACAEQATKPVVLVPVEERNAPTTIKNKPATIYKETSKEVNQQQEPVIIALLKDADKFSGQGQSSKAAATIERALRIEPRNALLWHRLSGVRFQQQQWQQTIAMARKSIALAGNNSSLKSDNWGLIAKAYDKLGDKRKANEARNKQTNQS
jgi:predicted Zn-dependent protease